MGKRKAAATAAATHDYDAFTVAALKSMCTKRGLDNGGKKAELVKRLEDSDNGVAPPKLKKQSTLQNAIDKMAKTVKAAEKGKVKSYKVDKFFGGHNPKIYKDYCCMLNQTNIGNNNNKYYVIQVIEENGKYTAFTRWGRVGEPGQNQRFGPYSDEDDAIKAFEKKFRDKTRNDWSARAKFKPSPGKYTMIEVSGDDEEETQSTVANQVFNAVTSKLQQTKPSKLNKETQELIRLILDQDMFKSAMANMEIDVKKMPLGKLSKMQIIKGFQVLEKIQRILRSGSTAGCTQLSNEFYTVIPHDFGRQRPPVIQDQDQLQKKLDMLNTLSDIELAQELLKKQQEKDKKKSASKDLPPHPLDANYDMLNCTLHLLDEKDSEFKVVKKYFESTRGSWGPNKILSVWRMDRATEDSRYKPHTKLENKKLLWHGTNVAVVAAILKSGLRIMPHSGGRVGRGIYFASECAKSACYVGTTNQGNKRLGIMFLNEVALGKEYHVTTNQCSLTAAPKGHDSVVAMGVTEPDPKGNTKLKLDQSVVVVPQAGPVTRSQWKSSHFSQSEYLVYKESQVRMRYLLKLQF